MNPRDFATTLMASLRIPLERALRDMRSDLSRAVEERVADIPVPKDGASVTVEDVAPLIESAVERVVSKLPVPVDGRSVTVEDVAPLIREEITRAVGALPPSVTADAVAQMVRDEVARQVAEIKLPEPVAPPSSEDVVRLLIPDVERVVAEAIAAIPPAKDGRNANPDDIELVARRLLDELPKPRDGRDGVATRDELETIVREAVAAAVPVEVDRAITDAIKSVPRMEYRGVWADALGECRKGDAVTFGGSLWICRADTTTAKPGVSADWQLAVKKGRDARAAA